MRHTRLIRWLAVFAVVWLFAQASRPKCHLHVLEKCFDRLHKLKDDKKDPSYLLTSNDGIDRICKVIKEDFVGCIQAFLNRCGTPLHKELSKVLSDAILEHLNEICLPESALRQEIVKHGPCVHEKIFSQKSFQRECNNPLFTTIAWGETKAHSEQPERSWLDYLIDTGCCSLRQWEKCAFPRITDQCSPQAQETLQATVGKLLGHLPNLMCYQDLFAPESDTCQAIPPIEQQLNQVNLTKWENHKFSLFSLVKMFLTRDAS